MNNENTGLFGAVRGLMKDIYQNTFFSSNKIKDDTEYIRNNINNTISDLIQQNDSVYGGVSMVDLCGRLSKDNNYLANVFNGEEGNDLFSSKNIEGMLPEFMKNRDLLAYDNQIDLIIKYFPSMRDVLSVSKDHVLYADRKTETFLNFENMNARNDETSDASDTFQSDMKYLVEKYNLEERLEDLYGETSTHGEQLVYTESWNEEIAKLLKSNGNILKNNLVQEQVNINEYTSLYDDKSIFNEGYDYNNPINEDMMMININKTGHLFSAINEASIREEFKDKLVFNESLSFADSLVANNKLQAIDGYTDNKTIKKRALSDRNKSNPKLDVKGCIFKVLPKENCILEYFEDEFIGAYYLECNLKQQLSLRKDKSSYMGNLARTNNSARGIFTNVKPEKEDTVLNFIARQVADKISAEFINDNPELAKEVYMILKRNKFSESGKSVNITFIPATKLIHMCFRKDKETHRGLSDLDDSMIPASMYVAITQSNALGIITRGFDRRVYYVKQRVDTNIAGTLIHTINSIRQANFGSREMCNPKTMLNVTGRFNDMVVPIGASGDAPVNMEVQPGQDIDTKQDFCEELKEQAIAPTPVPYEWIDQQKSVDFATRLTQASSKFLTFVLKRQKITARFFSQIIQRIYDFEFRGNDSKRAKVRVFLNVPSYMEELRDNDINRVVLENAQNVAEYLFKDDQDLEKKKFVFKWLADKTNINEDDLKEYYEYAMKESAKERAAQGAEESY